MKSKTLSAGDAIEAPCTRCRVITNHIIVAMVGERPARVECNTCGGVHNFREQKPARPAAAKAPERKAPARRSRKDPAAAEREEWVAISPTMNREKAIPYEMNRSYNVKDLLDHHVFGLGIVQQVTGPKKIEVLFEDGKKLLRCG